MLPWQPFWLSIYVVHIGATWRIRLNRRCAAAMRPYVKLLWPLVFISFQTWSSTECRYNKTLKFFKIILDVVPCPSSRRRSTVLKLFYFTRGSIIKYLAKPRPWSKLIAQAPAARGNFRLVCRRRPAAAWRLQYTNAAIGCNTVSWIFMLKLFYLISDVVPC